MSKKNSVDMDKNSESRLLLPAASTVRRLCGGPTLAIADADYWDSEKLRVAEAEGMAECSFPDLLRRIARAGLDLTLAGLARYMAADKRRKPLRSRKRSRPRPATNSLTQDENHVESYSLRD